MLSMEEILKKEVVYKIDNMENVNMLKDLAYKTIEKRELLMDIYSPFSKEQKEKLPVVVLVHGEAKSMNNFKDIGQYKSLGRLIAASGLNAVTFNHRTLVDGFTIKEINSDIDNLINYLVKNAEKLNIDQDRIAIWCISGGVPFGLYAGMRSYSDYVKCIIAYYGFGDFRYVGQVIDINILDEEIEKYSPINLINENSNKIPPLFIARAGLDNPIINESLDKFITKALINNLTIDIYNHSTGIHSFDLFNDNDRTYEIIAKSLKFLKKHLKK